METKKWTITDIYDIIKNTVEDPTLLATQNATDILNKLDKLSNVKDQKIIIHDFLFTNQEHVDITELSEKFGQNNLFSYYLSNFVNLENDNPINVLVTYLFKNETHTPEVLEEKETQIYISNLCKTKSTDEYIKAWKSLEEKLNSFCNYLFYLFSINLYKPSSTKTNVEIFKDYKKWISDKIMGDIPS